MPFPIAAAEIAKTEIKTGFTFPPGLKSRLAEDNGGELEVAGDCWQLIPFLDGSDRKRIARTCNDIVRETARMRVGGVFRQTRLLWLRMAVEITSSSVPRQMVRLSLARRSTFGITRRESMSRWPIRSTLYDEHNGEPDSGANGGGRTPFASSCLCAPVGVRRHFASEPTG